MNITARDTRPAWAPQHIDEAIKFIGQVCKDNNVNLSDLRLAFPHRPTNRDDVKAIMNWVNEYISAAKATAANLSRPSSPQVADGYFAIPAGQLGFDKPHFFRLHHGAKNGKWANTQFLKEQASDETYPVRGARRAQVMAWLAEHSDEARALYGQLISRCSKCNRTLTDHNNPYFPMYGPECGGK